MPDAVKHGPADEKCLPWTSDHSWTPAFGRLGLARRVGTGRRTRRLSDSTNSAQPRPTGVSRYSPWDGVGQSFWNRHRSRLRGSRRLSPPPLPGHCASNNRSSQPACSSASAYFEQGVEEQVEHLDDGLGLRRGSVSWRVDRAVQAATRGGVQQDRAVARPGIGLGVDCPTHPPDIPSRDTGGEFGIVAARSG